MYSLESIESNITNIIKEKAVKGNYNIVLSKKHRFIWRNRYYRRNLKNCKIGLNKKRGL